MAMVIPVAIHTGTAAIHTDMGTVTPIMVLARWFTSHLAIIGGIIGAFITAILTAIIDRIRAKALRVERARDPA